jgi:hypothetical protein
MKSRCLDLDRAVQACPGLRLVAYASESATDFEYVWSAIKPMQPSDKGYSYMIQVWARGSTLRVEKIQTGRITGIVSSSGYKFVSLNGV